MPPAHLFALWEIIWARDWGKVLDQGKVSPVVDGGHFAGQGLASGQRPYIDPIFTNDPLAGKTICKIQKMLLKKYYCEICQDISPVKILGGSHSYLVMRATDDYTDYNRLVVPFSFCNRVLIGFLSTPPSSSSSSSFTCSSRRSFSWWGKNRWRTDLLTASTCLSLFSTLWWWWNWWCWWWWWWWEYLQYRTTNVFKFSS